IFDSFVVRSAALDLPLAPPKGGSDFGKRESFGESRRRSLPLGEVYGGVRSMRDCQLFGCPVRSVPPPLAPPKEGSGFWKAIIFRGIKEVFPPLGGRLGRGMNLIKPLTIKESQEKRLKF